MNLPTAKTLESREVEAVNSQHSLFLLPKKGLLLDLLEALAEDELEQNSALSFVCNRGRG
jgi:hypothetical protein